MKQKQNNRNSFRLERILFAQSTEMLFRSFRQPQALEIRSGDYPRRTGLQGRFRQFCAAQSEKAGKCVYISAKEARSGDRKAQPP